MKGLKSDGGAVWFRNNRSFGATGTGSDLDHVGAGFVAGMYRSSVA